MKIEQRGAVTSMWYDVLPGWSQTYLFMSDNHHDSVHCNRKLEKEHLDEAKESGARVFLFGDTLDLMQGRFDPRRSMSGLRPEYRRDDYYDYVIQDTADFFAPYADMIDFVADGNHESSVLKNASINPGDRLCALLNQRPGAHVVHGSYGGWIRMLFTFDNHKLSKRIKYFHGAGGEAPVTRGVIQTNRQAAYIEGADIVVNGHSHHDYLMDIKKEHLGGKGEQLFDIVHFVRVPGYHDAYADGTHGWEVERGMVPKPQGCAWVTMTYRADSIKISIAMDVR